MVLFDMSLVHQKSIIREQIEMGSNHQTVDLSGYYTTKQLSLVVNA
jgi:hypothetical protein